MTVVFYEPLGLGEGHRFLEIGGVGVRHGPGAGAMPRWLRAGDELPLSPSGASLRRVAQGPPRVHERENTRRHPAMHAPTEPLVLQGFLYFLCPREPTLHAAEHDS